MFDWADCPVLRCASKVCLWAGTGRCYQHSVAVLGPEEMRRRYDETHPKPKRRRRWYDPRTWRVMP